MTPFAIAGIQMHVGLQDNLEYMQQRIELTMHLYPWVQMILFSELAPYGPSLSHAQELSAVEAKLAEMAHKQGVWLIPGSLFERKDGLIYNTTPVINPAGEVIARYRKMFPFAPYEEGVTGGDDFLVFDVEQAGRFGLCICYDMWFPETNRILTAKGAEVILHPVLTHSVDRKVELSMAHASAAMFQSYIFDINGLGAGGIGQSCVVDPAGNTLHQAGSHEGIIPIEVDFDLVRRQRQQGILNLGQPLKSFREKQAVMGIYNEEHWDSDYLDSLGPLTKPC